MERAGSSDAGANREPLVDLANPFGNDARPEERSGCQVSGTGDQYFREIVECVPAAIYTTDAAGRITFYNDAAAKLWGFRPELGQQGFCGSWKLFWPDGTPLPHDECPMALTLKYGRPIRGIEAIAERPDGTRIPFMPYPTPLYDPSGLLVGAVNLLVELTDRKQAEQVQQQLASIVESSDDAILSEDLDGVIVSWNRGAERLFGHRADEVIGKSITILIPSDRPDEETGILQRIRRGDRIEHYETVRQRKDGSRIDISLTVSPVKDAQGRIVGASKISRDITERRRAEAEKEMLLNELKHRVRNTLATVQALATQTMRGATGEERASFTARLQALAGAHDLLTHKDWDRAQLREIVRRALAPFQEKHEARLHVEGSDAIFIDAHRALLLTMTLHELATNAVKYGALSSGTGQVRITWELTNGNALRLQWRERGGPPVRPPQQKGFGSQLIGRALQGEGNSVLFEFANEGVTCTLDMTLI